MKRPLTRLAWAAALATYLLIVLGGVVRITGSGLGCGDEWPICHGRLIPSFADVPTLIEWSHRLVAALVSILVVSLAGAVWWVRKRRVESGESFDPAKASYLALGLLAIQIALGAVTVKLQLPPWTVVLHLGTAMLLFATLLTVAVRLTASVSPVSAGLAYPPAAGAALLVFLTVLAGALTANLGAATACVGFPLCNGQWIVTGNYLQYVQWGHRLLAFTTFAYLIAWALGSRQRGALLVLVVAAIQVVIAALMVSLGLPALLQVAHAAVGAAVWGTAVLVLSAAVVPRGAPQDRV